MADGIKERAVAGARWGVIENFSSLAVTFVVGIVLSRILSPEEFGLIGTLTIFIALSISLIDNGFSATIIKKPNPSSKDLSTAFTTNLTISLLCFTLLSYLSASIGRFFGEAQLAPLLRVLSFVLIINALSIIQRALLVKAVDFRRLTFCSLSSSIISGVVGIYLAFNGCGVWALVWQQISKQSANTLLLWIVGKWRLRVGFSMASFREMFAYGSKIMIAGLLDTIFRYLYYPVIGKHFSTSDLGQYSRAEQFSNVTSNNISQVIQKVSFPVLSKLQNDEERLRNSFRTIVMVCALISSFLCFTLSALSYPLIIGLVGEKWMPAARMLQIISLAGIFVPLHYLNQNILQIKEKMRLYLRLEIFKKVLIVFSVIVGIALDLDAMLWGLVAANTITYFVYSYFSGIHSGYNFFRQFTDILSPIIKSLISALVCGFAAAAMLWFFREHLGWDNTTWSNLIASAVGFVAGACTLIALYKLMPGKEFSEAAKLVKFWKR